MFPSFHKLTDAEIAHNVRLLQSAGFQSPEDAIRALMDLKSAASSNARQKAEHRSVPGWYRTLKRVLAEAPHPDAVLSAVRRFVAASASVDEALELFEVAPRAVEMLARIACGSPFLTQVVLSEPAALRQLATERRTAEIKAREVFIEEAQQSLQACPPAMALTALRRYHRGQILRIGMCDAFGLMDLKFVTLQLSLLADAMVQVCLRHACADAGVSNVPFCVLALGKHGGEELNYSSDIDLVLVAESTSADAQRVARRLMEALSQNLATGFLYRVDMRLRPWGDAGPLVTTVDGYCEYLANDAQSWEKQALLKARIVGGDAAIGMRLLKSLPAVLFSNSRAAVKNSVRRMKALIEDGLKRSGRLETEVKLGAGSIRDIEFLTQSLQLIHGRKEPRVASPNTLDALIRLTDFGILDGPSYRQLREGYVFFRTIEHALQLFQNQQTHELPTDPEQLNWLARRLDFQNADQLLSRFSEHRIAVRRIFEDYFYSNRQSVGKNAGTSDAANGKEAESGPLQFSVQEQRLIVHQLMQDVIESPGVYVYCSIDDHTDLHVVRLAGMDRPGMLSAICGAFLQHDIDIRSGVAAVGPGEVDGLQVPDSLLFGCFHVAAGGQPAPDGLSRRLQQSINELADQQQREGIEAAQKDLLAAFCARIESLPEPTKPIADLSIDVGQVEDEGSTRLQIDGDDSFGFFFEVANALSICRFQIQSARLTTVGDRIHDELLVREEHGGPVVADQRIEELRTAIVLIKQFTTWLPTNSDPHHALLRFRDLLRQILGTASWQTAAETLRQPQVLRDVGRVLGISRYLWEDFLRQQAERLLPLLEDESALRQRPRPAELLQEAERASAGDDWEASLNQFKDYHLFRIDLRHVLGYCGAFGRFSEEVTELAEVVLNVSVKNVWEELRARHGEPRDSHGDVTRFTFGALGKFGGVEMGFASDIEVLLIYEEEGRTDGPDAVSSATFFERLILRVAETIRSRRKGIFEIDLRMRPYGQAGPAAVTLQSCETYFSESGDAWPYERQSMVRLRCVGGASDFAEVVQPRLSELIYRPQHFDFDAMSGLRERQVRQLVRAGTINAKLSEGGLVDFEYAVQALQLTFGKRFASLQTINTGAALDAAVAAGLVAEQDVVQVRSAYQFLRQLIDCLRMVRGNAEDLSVPPPGSSDYEGLQRRLQAVHGGDQSLEQLESHMESIRKFAAHARQICERAAAESDRSPA
ncbi:MAG: hypothetical protein Fues2KO_06250 [Fuerstiella sp.]